MSCVATKVTDKTLRGHPGCCLQPRIKPKPFLYTSVLFHHPAFLFSISEDLYSHRRRIACLAYLALPLAPLGSSSRAALLLAYPTLSPVPVPRTSSRQKKCPAPQIHTQFLF